MMMLLLSEKLTALDFNQRTDNSEEINKIRDKILNQISIGDICDFYIDDKI